MVQDLIKRKELLEKELKDIKDAIQSLQKVCNHRDSSGRELWKYVGRDSHYEYFECSICLKETKI